MESSPVTCRTLEEYYHVKANTFERQYKDHLSGFRSWDQLGHADQWLVFADNVGASICIDETALSNGELYTIVTNRSCHGRKGTLIAMVKGVSADRVTEAIMHIDEHRRSIVQEITLDMSNSMHLIAKRCFPNAMRTIDRFHIQKLANDALQEMRIAHRWDAIQADTDAREEAKCWGYPTRRLCLPMAIRQDNCWHVADTCCSSRQTSGPKAKNGGRKSSSSNTPTSGKPIRLRTPYA